MNSLNFGFLEPHDNQLVALAGLAARYFPADPCTAIIKLRQFAKLMVKMVAAHHAVYRDERETFEETLRRLSYDRLIPKEAADIFMLFARPATAQRMKQRATIPLPSPPSNSRGRWASGSIGHMAALPNFGPVLLCRLDLRKVGNGHQRLLERVVRIQGQAGRKCGEAPPATCLLRPHRTPVTKMESAAFGDAFTSMLPIIRRQWPPSPADS